MFTWIFMHTQMNQIRALFLKCIRDEKAQNYICSSKSHFLWWWSTDPHYTNTYKCGFWSSYCFPKERRNGGVIWNCRLEVSFHTEIALDPLKLTMLFEKQCKAWFLKKKNYIIQSYTKNYRKPEHSFTCNHCWSKKLLFSSKHCYPLKKNYKSTNRKMYRT